MQQNLGQSNDFINRIIIVQLKLESAENLHIARPACRQPMMEYSVKDAVDRGLFSWDSFSLFLRNKSPSLEQILSVNGSLDALLWSLRWPWAMWRGKRSIVAAMLETAGDETVSPLCSPYRDDLCDTNENLTNRVTVSHACFPVQKTEASTGEGTCLRYNQ